MTTTRKWILWSVLVIFLVVAGFIAWGIASIPETLKDCYGQWVSAELVIESQEQHGRLPTSWQELEPIYGDGRGLHHGGLSFAQVQQRMIIEFPRLVELQTLVQTTTNAVSVPRVIYPKTGRRAHWSGAEPNQMVYDYFVEHKRSNTALEMAADEEHWFVQRIESIRVPSIQIDAALPSEALEYLRMKAREWESDRKPEERGFSMIATALNDSIPITYQNKNTTMKVVLQDFATLTAHDIHITTVGVFIVPTGEVPALQIKSPDARILKTYKPQKPTTKPSK